MFRDNRNHLFFIFASILWISFVDGIFVVVVVWLQMQRTDQNRLMRLRVSPTPKCVTSARAHFSMRPTPFIELRGKKNAFSSETQIVSFSMAKCSSCVTSGRQLLTDQSFVTNKRWKIIDESMNSKMHFSPSLSIFRLSKSTEQEEVITFALTTFSVFVLFSFSLRKFRIISFSLEKEQRVLVSVELTKCACVATEFECVMQSSREQWIRFFI